MEKKAYIKMEILKAVDAMNQEMEKQAGLTKAWQAARAGYTGLKAGLQKGPKLAGPISKATQRGQSVGRHLRKNKNVYAAGAGGVAAGAGGMAVANKMNEPDTIRERLAAAYQALRG